MPYLIRSACAALAFDNRRAFLRLQQVLQLRHELLHVFEVQVNRGEAHVGYFVVLAQAVHDQLADFAGFALAVSGVNDEALGVVDNLLQLANRDRALFAGSHQAVQHFLPIETLAPAVFLDHHVRDLVNPLVGGEALPALQTLPPPADGLRFLALARIHHLVVQKPAKRAFHRCCTNCNRANISWIYAVVGLLIQKFITTENAEDGGKKDCIGQARADPFRICERTRSATAVRVGSRLSADATPPWARSRVPPPRPPPAATASFISAPMSNGAPGDCANTSEGAPDDAPSRATTFSPARVSFCASSLMNVRSRSANTCVITLMFPCNGASASILAASSSAASPCNFSYDLRAARASSRTLRTCCGTSQTWDEKTVAASVSAA